MFVKLSRSLTQYHNGNIIKIYSDPSGIVFLIEFVFNRDQLLHILCNFYKLNMTLPTRDRFFT